MPASKEGRPGIPDEGMRDYLGCMFNHGAAMTNVFGWDIGEKERLFRRATGGDERPQPAGRSAAAPGLTRRR